jgi:hypothetical protein
MSLQEINNHINNILSLPEMFFSSLNSLDDGLYHLNVVRGPEQQFKKLINQKFNRKNSNSFNCSYEEAVIIYKEIENEIKRQFFTKNK